MPNWLVASTAVERHLGGDETVAGVLWCHQRVIPYPSHCEGFNGLR